MFRIIKIVVEALNYEVKSEHGPPAFTTEMSLVVSAMVMRIACRGLPVLVNNRESVL